jgi:hypothetical protein
VTKPADQSFMLSLPCNRLRNQVMTAGSHTRFRGSLCDRAKHGQQARTKRLGFTGSVASFLIIPSTNRSTHLGRNTLRMAQFLMVRARPRGFSGLHRPRRPLCRDIARISSGCGVQLDLSPAVGTGVISTWRHKQDIRGHRTQWRTFIYPT